MMRRRLVAAGALVLALLTAASPAHAADASIDVLSVDAKGSDVTVVVAPDASLAGTDLTKATWKVSQDGKRVKVQVVPVSNANLEVVLALDTSGSMAGAPMEAAKAAAEAFVAGLPSVARVALVSFSSSPNVLVPMTSDRSAVVGAIRGLRAQGETALFDGVRTAASQFTAGNGVRRQLVLLSDGGDTVSGTDEAGAIAALTAAKVTGYVASLVTPDSATEVLNNLAKASGGRVVSATDVSAIQSVFGSIGNVLTNQYRLTFPAVTTGQAALAVSVSAGSAKASVDRVIEIPKVSTPTTLPQARVMPAADQDWMKLVGFSSAGLGMLALALFAFVAPRKRRLTSRFISEHTASKAHDTSLQDLTNRASAMAQRSLERRGWASRLDVSLERSGMPFRPGEFILLALGAVFGAFLVGFTFFGPFVAVAFAVAAAFLSRTVLRMKVSRRRSKFESQLGDTLQLLSGSLRAGYGLVQALDAVAKNSESPSADEFNRLIMEMRVGRDLPDALGALATRIGSDDFEWVVEAITINREIGGDLTELLDRAAKTIRERDNVRRQIKSLSAEGKLSAYVLIAIPIFLLLYMRVANPDYAGVLTSTPMGLVMLSMAGAGIGLGGLWLKKIVKVDF
jgi:tight adherence protein B